MRTTSQRPEAKYEKQEARMTKPLAELGRHWNQNENNKQEEGVSSKAANEKKKESTREHVIANPSNYKKPKSRWGFTKVSFHQLDLDICCTHL